MGGSVSILLHFVIFDIGSDELVEGLDTFDDFLLFRLFDELWSFFLLCFDFILLIIDKITVFLLHNVHGIFVLHLDAEGPLLRSVDVEEGE